MYELARLDNRRASSRYCSISASKMTFLANKCNDKHVTYYFGRIRVFFITIQTILSMFLILVPPSGQKKKKTNF